MMQRQELNVSDESADAGKRMPVLFLGHGSPMNAIGNNEFSRGWREVAKSLPLAGSLTMTSLAIGKTV
jgi:4,5-DOPA dioxygenase extradiol